MVALKLFLVSRLRHLENSLNFARGRGQAGLGDDVSQVLTRNQEQALFQLETSILKSCQVIAKVLQLVSVIDFSNQDVIQVHCHVPHVPEKVFHLPLKDG